MLKVGLELFWANLGGDETSLLYQKFIDSQKREMDIGASSVFACATSSSLTLGNLQLADSGGLYRCVVTNTFGSDTSPIPTDEHLYHGDVARWVAIRYETKVRDRTTGQTISPTLAPSVASRFHWPVPVRTRTS